MDRVGKKMENGEAECALLRMECMKVEIVGKDIIKEKEVNDKATESAVTGSHGEERATEVPH